MSLFTPAIPLFLTADEKQNFIGGKWLAAASGETLETRNPATGAVLPRIARGAKADIDLAVTAARQAFVGGWSRYTPAERQKLLIKVHDLFDRHYDELALIETLDMGGPLARGLARKQALLQAILFYATQPYNCCGQTIPNSLPGNYRTMTVKAPVGVVGGIIPWNAPVSSQLWIIGPVLATGCTLVLKPAEDASLVALRTAELLAEAGVPEGVFNVVTGLGAEAGAALAQHPDVNRIAFTGSVETARSIVQSSAINMKRVSLELGGKSPDVIFADADLDKAVAGAAMGALSNSGQICVAGSRILVQRDIESEFLARLKKFTSTLKVGNPLDPETSLGPLVSQKQLDRVAKYVQIGRDEGAKLICGGDRLQGAMADGYYIEPAIFANVNNSMTIAREEIFGPVISVIPFGNADDALKLANDTEYGLAGAVWTSNIKTMNQMAYGLQAGTVWVNCYGANDPSVGFGGYKNSGYGWKGGNASTDSYLFQKAITINGD
jgi:aldehyde dehydrogenase (NAD+)